ncbi:hypothetical protein F0L68_40550 [Solihabitans fulvus]|uniref:Uncharacterized protein n=1 Tax=Solihabitans fulvus TaxID=1892852 RepID=A0A5B2W7P8_9PSEU|nr:hypothetical protein [Solihabitans fulvus]KAA2246760.1 hypothetical protein F0L68_40550 [Solihabitans fulvus]
MRKFAVALAVAASAILGVPVGLHAGAPSSSAAAAAEAVAPAAVPPTTTTGNPPPGGSYCTLAGDGPSICDPASLPAYVTDLPDPCACPYAWLAVFAGQPPPEQTLATFRSDEAGGFSLLSTAAVTADPGTAGQLRFQAFNTLLDAARQLGDTTLGQPVAGFLDPQTRQFTPYGLPWRQDIANHATAGTALLQKSLHGGDPQSLTQQAMAEFDAAYRTFAQHTVRGS